MPWFLIERSCNMFENEAVELRNYYEVEANEKRLIVVGLFRGLDFDIGRLNYNAGMNTYREKKMMVERVISGDLEEYSFESTNGMIHVIQENAQEMLDQIKIEALTIAGVAKKYNVVMDYGYISNATVEAVKNHLDNLGFLPLEGEIQAFVERNERNPQAVGQPAGGGGNQPANSNEDLKTLSPEELKSYVNVFEYFEKSYAGTLLNIVKNTDDDELDDLITGLKNVSSPLAVLLKRYDLGESGTVLKFIFRVINEADAATKVKLFKATILISDFITRMLESMEYITKDEKFSKVIGRMTYELTPQRLHHYIDNNTMTMSLLILDAHKTGLWRSFQKVIDNYAPMITGDVVNKVVSTFDELIMGAGDTEEEDENTSRTDIISGNMASMPDFILDKFSEKVASRDLKTYYTRFHNVSITNNFLVPVDPEE
jgi:hypothetical protein